MRQGTEMKNAAITICALAVLFGAPAAAAPPSTITPKLDANAQARLAAADQRDNDLSLLAEQTRERLIRDPSQIAAVIEAAAAADVATRAQIELGIVRALEYLKRFDRAGYQAIADYLEAHPDNPIVADVDEAVNALAQLGGSPGGQGGSGGGGGGGGGGFSSGGGSPSSPQ
jgi:uncharacterized membrane protein YgcG